MFIHYENSKFHVNLKNSLEVHLVKQLIKKKIGNLIKKPYVIDEYLAFAQTILEKCKSGVVVDIGCNIGTTVIPLARKYPKATFYAIEPHPVPAARFIQNCGLNHIQNVKLISCAIGCENSLAKIYTCPNNSGGHRLTGFKDREDLEGLKAFGPISIPMKTLKDVFNELEIQQCDLLKIDTEGYETLVLKSLEELLSPRSVRNIITEMGSEGLAKANSSPSELFSIVTKAGYHCKLLQGGREIHSEKDLPELPPFVVKDLVFSCKADTP